MNQLEQFQWRARHGSLTRRKEWVRGKEVKALSRDHSSNMFCCEAETWNQEVAALGSRERNVCFKTSNVKAHMSTDKIVQRRKTERKMLKRQGNVQSTQRGTLISSIRGRSLWISKQHLWWGGAQIHKALPSPCQWKFIPNTLTLILRQSAHVYLFWRCVTN